MSTKIKTPDELHAVRQAILDRRDIVRPCVTVCGGTGCYAYGCQEVIAAFREELRRRELENKIDLRVTGCHGFCERGPLVVVHPREVFYQRVTPKDVPEILSAVRSGEIIYHLLYADVGSEERIVREEDIPFYKKQKRLVFGSNGQLDPTRIEDYLALDGYQALARVLSKMTYEEVIEEVIRSGLRGRGGAGFPTGLKWRYCRQAPGDLKYVVCNADEGDPGAYMDRSLLEGNPHSVLEGMSIGAHAIGARIGYIYVRNEYPLAVRNARIAIAQAEEHGLLGKDILGSGFDFTVRISRGAGAFVCGEETGLIASIEGRVGEPRPRPPYPASQGLWGWPTNINNVETWANIPLILRQGGDWYAEIGTERSKGTKIFSLVGKVKNVGLVEVPMGITLKEIIYDIGGGIPGNKQFKAVQTGGPSGGCIPEAFLGLPVDYEHLTQAGAMMGSGGLIVMDETTCMIDMARYFLSFLRDESCGKCTPCREGIERMHEILTEISQGRGTEADVALLEELAQVIKETSLCALGSSAPNPVLTTLRYFRPEYEAHIRDRRCPAGVCKELIRFSVDGEECVGCGACRKVCPQEAITGEIKAAHRIDQEKCIKCGLCSEVCRFEAIEVV